MEVEILMKLDPTDRIEAVVAEPANGPGWSNTPLWVFVQDCHGKIRRECLQPEEQGDHIRLLYATAAALHDTLKREVEILRKVQKT